MTMLGFKNTLIEPLSPSKIISRFSTEISTASCLGGITLQLPIVSSPMDSIDNPLFFKYISQLGGIGIVHRFMDAHRQVELYEYTFPEGSIVAVGLGSKEKIRVEDLYDAGAKHFLIDVANGFSEAVVPMIKLLKSKNCWVMAGNVASGPGYRYLAELGVDAVRVGIGTGAACSTRIMTGVGYPILSALESCRKVKSDYGFKTAIVADGGIKEPGDFVKSLIAGADAIMMGYVFSKCVESQYGLKMHGKRLYRGMASYSAQLDAGKTPKTSEGEEITVTVDTTIEEVMTRFSAGLRSAMSYLDARTIEETREGGRLIEIPPGLQEGFSS